MKELDRREFLNAAATGALVAGLGFDNSTALGDERKEGRNTRAGQWLQFRGDRALTGRSPLKGNIREPAIRWKQFCGARETLLSVSFQPQGDKKATVELPVTNLGVDPRIRTDERLQALSSYNGASFGPGFQVGKFLPEESGLQIVQCESCFQKYASYQPPGTGEFCQLLTRRNGEWHQVWKSELIPQVFVPNVLAGDFDHDGKLEIAFTPWYDLLVLDMATGKLKDKCRFSPPGAESGRAYGYLGAFDLDGDGKQEFVLLPDFENQMAVLGWREGKLQVLWNRLIERGIGNKKTLFRPGAEPVQDIDGDGKMEIVVSQFNTTGDDKWHVVALDAMTGGLKLDLPGEYLAGVHDLDANGIPELFLTRTQGPLIKDPSALSIIAIKDGLVVRRWELEDSAFQARIITDFPTTVQNSSTTRGWTVLVEPPEADGMPVFFTRKVLDPRTGATELVAWQADKMRKVRRVGSVLGPHLEALVADPGLNKAKTILVKAEVPVDSPAQVESQGAWVQPIFSRRNGAPSSTAVVARLESGSPPTIVAQGARETLQAFRLNSTGSAVEPQWRLRGRGMRLGVKNAGGVALADLRGNGKLAVVAATVGANGCARLIAVDSAGQELWAHDFDRFPGEQSPLNVGGLFFWFPGRFNDPHRDDVLVSLARAQTHSEEGFLLDGRTGKEIWHRTVGSHFGPGPGMARAFGGGWMAISDHDGDGFDDILTMYPDGILVVQGSTGKTLLDRSTNGRYWKGIFAGEWTFMAIPVVAEFLGKGKRQMLYGASTYRLGLLDMDGNVIWQESQRSTPRIVPGIGEVPPGPLGSNVGNHSTPAILPAIGDADGDGRLELLSPGHSRGIGSREQEFHCYDAATGRLKWALPLPGSCFDPNMGEFADSPTSPASADIDGDGREEAVFGIGSKLYAVGASHDGQAGEIRWTLEFPAPVGPPSIADVDGDGRAEIVVVCEDGHVCVVGPRPIRG
jgi:outer membrane protein assembly factor BamB